MPGKLDPAVTTQGQGIIFSAFAAAVIGGVSLGGVSLGGVSLGGVSLGGVRLGGVRLGGVRLGGGRGTMMGLVSGVLLIGVINNLLMLAQVPQFHVQARTGAVIIIAAVLTTIASRRSSGVKTLT